MARRDGLHKRRGIWHYKLKVKGRWKETSTKSRKHAEAREIYHQAKQELKSGQLPADMAKWTLGKAVERWKESRDGLVAPKTYQTDSQRLKPVLRELGTKRLGDFTFDDLEAYQHKRRKKVGNRTVNLEMKVLRMILKRAKLWIRFADDYKPLPENKRGPGRALSPEDEKKLFKMAATKSQWTVAYYAAVVAADTTARSCELKGLRICDVDLIEQTIRIQRKTTKTDAGCRIIPLTKPAALALTRLLERARHLGATEQNHFLFPAFRFRHTREGEVAGLGYDPTKPMKSWRTAWRSLTNKAGLPGLRFHDLRHHCITKLAERGTPEQTLMSIAGHVSKEMLEHYSHIRMQAKRDAIAKLEPPKPATDEQPNELPVN
jgi:integrase